MSSYVSVILNLFIISFHAFQAWGLAFLGRVLALFNFFFHIFFMNLVTSDEHQMYIFFPFCVSIWEFLIQFSYLFTPVSLLSLPRWLLGTIVMKTFLYWDRDFNWLVWAGRRNIKQEKPFPSRLQFFFLYHWWRRLYIHTSNLILGFYLNLMSRFRFWCITQWYKAEHL